MDEIISMIIAQGLWAVLFCGLLVYELRDSRKRETRFTETIRSLTDRLGAVSAVKSNTDELKADVKTVKSNTEAIKAVCVTGGGKSKVRKCATT